MLEKIKKALRISHDQLDDEITDLIEACKLDMKISGVNVINETDPLIIRAVITYSKANFGLVNEDSEKYTESFKSQVIHLATCGDYNVVQ
ncbi:MULTISPECIES: head-tail connector protein [Bacillus]|uniref:head-tail connector protein n=1 Tax=Bacillus TaxID=1386 RepID=UPI000475D757|nr:MULTISPECIES: head-tail connector protein [Bacillus]